MPSTRALLLLPLVLVLGLAGCRERQITSYRAPKETPVALPPAVSPDASAAAPMAPMSAPTAAGTMAGTMAGTAVPTASGADLKWTAPAGWQSKPASAMRKATFTIPGDAGAEAELSITAFPGDVGGELANLNRWRGQVELPALTAAEVDANVTRFASGGLKLAFADLNNDKASPPKRMLGAIVPVGDATWFFKLSGPPALLEKEKPAFLDFLKTIKAP
jgi:hypothetical protein